MQSPSTAENLFLEAANGVRYAYRRFGNAKDAPPLLFLQHFRGNLENWDPLLVDILARDREAILLDNTGIGLSSGSVPPNVTQMARDALAFLDALRLSEIDLLGYSLGGFVAQEVALLRPRLVRRIVLAGTGPQGGGEGMNGWIPDVFTVANAENNKPEDLLWLFFAPTETSQQKGREYLKRVFSRREGRDKPNGMDVAHAQYDAIVEWGIPDPSRLARLRGIIQPHPDRERGARHDDPGGEQPHPRAAHSEFARADLRRRGPRLSLSVPDRVRSAGVGVSGVKPFRKPVSLPWSLPVHRPPQVGTCAISTVLIR